MSTLSQFVLKQAQANDPKKEIDTKIALDAIEKRIKEKKAELDAFSATENYKAAKAIDDNLHNVLVDGAANVEYRLNEQQLIKLADELERLTIKNDALKKNFPELEEGKISENLDKLKKTKGDDYTAECFRASPGYNADKFIIAKLKREIEPLKKKKEGWDALISKATEKKPIIDQRTKLAHELTKLLGESRELKRKQATMAAASATATAPIAKP